MKFDLTKLGKKTVFKREGKQVYSVQLDIDSKLVAGHYSLMRFDGILGVKEEYLFDCEIIGLNNRRFKIDNAKEVYLALKEKYEMAENEVRQVEYAKLNEKWGVQND